MSARSDRWGRRWGWAAALLAGCAVGPNFTRPPAPDVAGYVAGPAAGGTVSAAGQTQRFVLGREVAADWWRLFRCRQLDDIMADALAHNPSLQAAQASLGQSQASLRAGYGVFFPQIGVAAGAAREQYSPASLGQSGAGKVFNLFTLSASVSYALDIFGGQRRAVEALRAQSDVQRGALLGTYLMLSANVVNTAIAQGAYQAQIKATQDLLGLLAEQIKMTRVQADAGTVPYASVLSLQSQAASTRAQIPPLEQKMDQAQHLLAVLSGQAPAQWRRPSLTLEELTLPRDLPVSLPAELVRQRPDVLVAEAQVHASNAHIGVATAAMLPRISLSAGYGVGALNPADLFSGTSALWNLGANLAAPLFTGGTLYYQRKAAIAAHEQTLASYRQTVLAAFQQVADTLRGLEHDAQALSAQGDALQAAQEALKLVQIDYQAGIAGYLQVLTADEQYLQAKIAYIQATAQRLQDTVALYAALGGGWWNAPQRTHR